MAIDVVLLGSASFMASVGSALLCSLLASFSADVSVKSSLLLPALLLPALFWDLSDRKLKALDFGRCLCGG